MLDRLDYSPDLLMTRPDVWLVYDGECPYSRAVSKIIRIQNEIGKLVLLDARSSLNHPLVRDLGREGYDLNQGLVIRYQNHFYHAREALQLLARIEADGDVFNWLHARLLRSRSMATLTASCIQAIRAFTLWISGKPGLTPPHGP